MTDQDVYLRNAMQQKREHLTNKLNELRDELRYREDQVLKLEQAIKTLDLLENVEEFIVW